jgi:hypothetical protein
VGEWVGGAGKGDGGWNMHYALHARLFMEWVGWAWLPAAPVNQRAMAIGVEVCVSAAGRTGVRAGGGWRCKGEGPLQERQEVRPVRPQKALISASARVDRFSRVRYASVFDVFGSGSRRSCKK